MVSRHDQEPPPVAVEVWRGDRVESQHRVSFALADRNGRLVAQGGDVEQAVLPRSAVKPLQALAVVESGAADHFGLDARELALAAASHGGEPRHVAAVRPWLERLGLDETALECGAHPPSHRPSAEALLGAGEAPGPVHNNCSGKHTGMLTLARHLGVEIRGYLRPEHPVQTRIAAILAAMAGLDHLPPPAIDGCGVPTWPLPLARLATAFARFADPSGLDAARAEACVRIRAAMSAHPEMVAGSGRACTAILTAVPAVTVKTGAEGVYVAALPAAGLGLALKVEDGATRAAEVALIALLDALGALDDDARAVLTPFARPTLVNHAGTVVGRIRPSLGWPDLPDTLPSRAARSSNGHRP